MKRPVPVTRVRVSKDVVAFRWTLTTTGRPINPHQRGRVLLTLPSSGTAPGSETTAAIAFSGTRSSKTTGPFTCFLYAAGNDVVTSTRFPLTRKVGSSEHHSKPASALPADDQLISSAKTNAPATRRITSTPSDLPHRYFWVSDVSFH